MLDTALKFHMYIKNLFKNKQLASDFIDENTILTEREKEVIVNFIEGSSYFRIEIVRIYHRLLENKVTVNTPNWYLCYLSELFNICPDFRLKYLCKDKILEQESKKQLKKTL